MAQILNLFPQKPRPSTTKSLIIKCNTDAMVWGLIQYLLACIATFVILEVVKVWAYSSTAFLLLSVDITYSKQFMTVWIIFWLFNKGCLIVLLLLHNQHIVLTMSLVRSAGSRDILATARVQSMPARALYDAPFP